MSGPKQATPGGAPIAGDAGSRRLVTAVLAVATLIAIVLAAVGINPREMIALAVVLAACLGFALTGRLLPARAAAPLAGLVVFGLLVFRNAGLRDVAMLGLPAVIAGAGLVIGRWGVLAYGAASLGMVAVLGVLDLGGWRPMPAPPANRVVDYVAAGLGLALITSLQWLVIGRLNETIRRVRESEREQRQAYDDLREASAALHALLAALPDAIFRLDRGGTCRGFLPSRGTDLLVAGADVVGRRLEEVLPPVLAGRVADAVRRVLEEGGVHDVTSPVETGGTRADYEVRITAVDRESAVAVVRDVTAREQAAAERERLLGELAAKNAELERFTYTVSHDLKSPLITITAYAGMIERDAAAGATARIGEDAGRIARACGLMRLLLDDLLELSRIGRVGSAPVDVRLDEVVRESRELVAGRLEAAGVRVTVREPLPVVRGDRGRLVQVIQNLLENAAKFSGGHPHPAVEIGTRPGGGDGLVTVYVSDNGRGVEPGYHERIFGLFSKLDPASDGTGVGLALVRRIAEVHGGRAWVESEGAGRGATFLCTLPLAAAQAATHG